MINSVWPYAFVVFIGIAIGISCSSTVVAQAGGDQFAIGKASAQDAQQDYVVLRTIKCIKPSTGTDSGTDLLITGIAELSRWAANRKFGIAKISKTKAKQLGISRKFQHKFQKQGAIPGQIIRGYDRVAGADANSDGNGLGQQQDFSLDDKSFGDELEDSIVDSLRDSGGLELVGDLTAAGVRGIYRMIKDKYPGDDDVYLKINGQKVWPFGDDLNMGSHDRTLQLIYSASRRP